MIWIKISSCRRHKSNFVILFHKIPDNITMLNLLNNSEALMYQHTRYHVAYYMKCNEPITFLPALTQCGRVTHICVSKLTIIGSDNGLSPGRRQAIIWTNAGMLLIGPIGVISDEISIMKYLHSWKSISRCCLEKWRPFYLGRNGLKQLVVLHFVTRLYQHIRDTVVTRQNVSGSIAILLWGQQKSD